MIPLGKDDGRPEENQVTIAQVRLQVAAAVKAIHRELERLQAVLEVPERGEEGGHE